METRKQLTTKFFIGAGIIAASLIIGKLVLIPLLLYPSNKTVQMSMLAIYVFSWIMLIPGVYLAGKEGYLLVMHKYREYGNKTLDKMRAQGRKAAKMADETLNGMTGPVKKTKKSSMLQKKKR